jgi:aminoglycoside phosphotransferase (APT) family kinase protein
LDNSALKYWQLKLIRRSPGRHSEILECHSPARARGVIVKRITGGWRRPEDAEATVLREYRALAAIRKCLPANLLHTVPTPLAVVPASKTLVLEQMKGMPLSRILKREANRLIGRFRISRMNNLGRLAGRWLNEVHQAASSDPQPHDSQVFLEEFEQRITWCRRLGVSEHTVASLTEATRAASRRFDGQLEPMSARHGDFTPQNVLIDGDHVSVVDFENFNRADCVYEDIATFLAYVQTMSAFPYYSKSALAALNRSFLGAYGLTGEEPLMRLYLARALVVLVSETNPAQKTHFGQNRLELLQQQLEAVCTSLLPAFAR